MNQLGSIQASDNILHLAWDQQGECLAITPSTGDILVMKPDGHITETRRGHAMGNGQSAWFLGGLATCGFDGKICLGNGREFNLGRGLIERLKTSPDGKLLAANQGKSLHILDQDGGTSKSLPPLPTSVADFAWNPANPCEVAIVGAGGARMWRLGESEAFARFDWGGASLLVDWSACGRWLVTGDQTPSVHIYDFSRNYPLHIQGYDTKVQALAFSPDGCQLATGGSMVVTIWPCTGATGPEGVTPLQLDGHDQDVIVAAYSPVTGQLATGDDTGTLLIFTFEKEKTLRKRLRLQAGISAIAWHPFHSKLAVGQSDGTLALLSI